MFLNALNHLILFAAALTATSDHGRIVDLAARQRPLSADLERPSLNRDGLIADDLVRRT